MVISNFLEQQKKMFDKAKIELESSRLKKPDREFPTRMKIDTLDRLKARVDGLYSAREHAIEEFDIQIKDLANEISRLEKEIKKGDERLSTNPVGKPVVLRKKSKVVKNAE